MAMSKKEQQALANSLAETTRLRTAAERDRETISAMKKEADQRWKWLSSMERNLKRLVGE
jgi:hypothetical protein